MKINEFIGSVVDRYSKQSKAADDIKTKKQKSPLAVDSTKNRVDGDRVEISENAKLLSQLGCKDNDRMEKIEHVKATLNSGTYKPNIDKIAKSVLKEWEGE